MNGDPAEWDARAESKHTAVKSGPSVNKRCHREDRRPDGR